MRILALIAIAFFALPLSGNEILIPIAGSIGVFRTDARIFNPSFTDTITVEAYLLDVGNVDNSAATRTNISLAPREMRVLDDVVSSLFGKAGILAGIRLVSQDEIRATARVYAQTADGTLGQFIVGTPLENALTRGVLLQLEVSPAFRTNVGLLNAEGTMDANVTLRLFDRNNNEVKSIPLTLEPHGVIGPTSIVTLFESPAGDLTDAWISFESDKPVVIYGSVVDEKTTDQTFVPAVSDPGVPPVAPPEKVFEISAFQFEYGVTPVSGGGTGSGDRFEVNVGDRVTLHITAQDVTHGFSMGPYVNSRTLNPGQSVTVQFDATTPGQFTFFCTVVCGGGHGSMSGVMTVK